MENFRLRVFRSAARHLNFRMAAEELLLTQPAITQQIKALESELNTALFDRSGGKLALTPAGAALFPYAEELFTLSERAREAVAATTGELAGTLTIAASQTIAQYLLPRLIAAFILQHPQVELETISGNTLSALQALTDHRAQLALIEGPALRQDLKIEPFMEDHMVCVVPPEHEWADEEVSIQQLQQAVFVTRELGSGSRRIVEQALEAAGVHLRDLSVRITFDTTEGLLSAIEAGLGIGFVSRWTVRNQIALGTLRVAHIRGLKLARMFSIATPSGPEPVGIVAVFHRFLLERAEDLAPRPTGHLKSK
jgi:DNA-binding transcriptional LysR family regulator